MGVGEGLTDATDKGLCALMTGLEVLWFVFMFTFTSLPETRLYQSEEGNKLVNSLLEIGEARRADTTPVSFKRPVTSFNFSSLRGFC